MGYNIKPVIYGSLAVWLSSMPRRFALITGLGYAFQGEGQRGQLQALVQRLYAMALLRVGKVFFQNPDDEALFRQHGLLAIGTSSCVVNGLGMDVDVDVDVYSFTVAPLPPGQPRFLLMARLVGDKAVREYAQGAGCTPHSGSASRCALYFGWIDSNPTPTPLHKQARKPTK